MKKSLDWTIMEEFVGRLTDLWENENWQKVNHHDHTTAKKKDVAEAYTPSPAKPFRNPPGFNKQGTGVGNKLAQQTRAELAKKKQQGVAEGLPQTLRKVVPGYAKREIDKKMDAGKFGKTDADKDANFQRYKKIQDKIKDQGVAEDWNKINHHDKTNGLSQKAVNAYRHEHPGSKLKTAVTTKPSKLKAGSKDAKRRKSFCARMSGNEGPMKKPNGEPTPKALALRRWNCESIEEMQELIQLGEQYIANLKENLANMKNPGMGEYPALTPPMENFADGRHPEDKGDSARLGIPKHASISSLRKIAHQGGRKGQLAHWQANMRSGHNK